MQKFYSTFLLGMLLHSICHAQFSPPGLGKANTATWFAIGVEQHLNQKETISASTHFGLGRISNPDDYNLLEKHSIYVVNEEVTFRSKKHWSYSLALSYRLQNKYESAEPYGLDTPKARQEIRAYSRFSYLDSFNGMDYSFSYRPEIRFFYNPNFSPTAEHTQFRSRLSGKMAFNLNPLKTQKIIATAEALFSISKTDSWSTFEYDEARFCLYYSVVFPKQKITFNVGYMNNLLGKSSPTDVHYLAMDIVLKNPFEK